MLAASHTVGRIIEARAEGVIAYPEFLAFRSSVQELLARVAYTEKAIIVGDLRGAGEMSADVAPAVLGMLRADNARIDCAAHWVTAESAFHRQYEALVGRTHNPLRRVFTESSELQSWLGPRLSEAERERLRAMLAR